MKTTFKLTVLVTLLICILSCGSKKNSIPINDIANHLEYQKKFINNGTGEYDSKIVKEYEKLFTDRPTKETFLYYYNVLPSIKRAKLLSDYADLSDFPMTQFLVFEKFCGDSEKLLGFGNVGLNLNSSSQYFNFEKSIFDVMKPDLLKCLKEEVLGSLKGATLNCSSTDAQGFTTTAKIYFGEDDVCNRQLYIPMEDGYQTEFGKLSEFSVSTCQNPKECDYLLTGKWVSDKRSGEFYYAYQKQDENIIVGLRGGNGWETQGTVGFMGNYESSDMRKLLKLYYDLTH